MGEYAKKKFEALKKKHRAIRAVRCYGLMIGLELDSPDLAKTVARQMLEERKIVINRTHETVLRMLPPYIVEKKHIDQVAKALDEALGKF